MRKLLLLLILCTPALATSPPAGATAIYLGSTPALSDGATVTTWADTSGNGFDLVTAAGSPKYNLQTTSGIPGVYFIFAPASRMTIPAGVSANTRSTTICLVLDSTTSSYNLGPMVPVMLGTQKLAFYLDGTLGVGSFLNAGQVPTMTTASKGALGPTAQCATFGASNTKIYREFGVTTGSVQTSTTVTGGFVGAYNSSSGFPFEGTILEIRIYPSEFSADTVTQYLQYAHETFGTATPNATRRVNVVHAGDSITQGIGSTLERYWANLIYGINGLVSRAHGVDLGITGTTVATMLGVTSNMTAQYNASYAYNILWFFAGTNDLTACTDTSDCNTKEATLETNTTAYVTAMHRAGFKVIVTTMLTRGSNVAAFDVARLTFNAWLRTLSNSGADAVADPGGSAFMGVLPQTVGYFNGDAIHPTNLGYLYMATNYMEPTLTALIGKLGSTASNSTGPSHQARTQ